MVGFVGSGIIVSRCSTIGCKVYACICVIQDWTIIETVDEVHICMLKCLPFTVLKCVYLMQSMIVLQTITKSYAWGLISSRDFVDLLKWGCVEESGLYYTCGKTCK